MPSLKVIEKTIFKEISETVTNYMLESLIKMYKKGAKDVNVQLGIRSEWRGADEEAIKFIKNYRTPYFKDLTETTKKYLFGTLKETLEKGETWDVLYDKLKDNRAFSKKRAELIWRTEMCRAHDAGAHARMKALGVKEGYIDVHPDGCPLCMPYHRKVMPLKDLPVLPLHPRCRCVRIPIPPEPEKLQKKLKDLKEKQPKQKYGKYQKYYDEGVKIADEIFEEIGEPEELFDHEYIFKFNDALMKRLGEDKNFRKVVRWIDAWQDSSYRSESKALEEMASLILRGEKIPQMRDGKLQASLYREKHIQAMAKAIGISRRYYESVKYKPLFVMRGVQDEYAESIWKGIQKDNKKYVEEYALTSYSIHSEIAEYFATDGEYFGLQYARKIKTEDVGLIPSIFTMGLIDEGEIIVAGSTIELSPKMIMWKGYTR